jgi:hypothetical protein
MEVQQRETNVYKCVPSAPTQTPAAPSQQPSVTPSAPPAAAAPSITCQGGSIQNNKCICPQGTHRQRTGRNAYRCAPIVPGPLQRIIPQLLR